VDLVESSWVLGTFIPTVQQRGASIIEARGLSSAASAANAVIEHMRDWVNGTNGEMVSMGIYSDGCYGVEEGLIFSFPVICKDGSYSVVLGLSINELSQDLIKRTEAELKEEKEGVSALLP
jgi:malate dehydrogenase